LVRHRGTADPHVYAGGLAPRVRNSLAHRGAAALAPLHHDDGALRSYNLLPSRWARRIDRAGADVVNIHWVGAETLSIADIGNIRSPLVLTLHDMWAFCGGEHYAPDGPAARWRTGYRAPAAGGRSRIDLDASTWRRKRRHWRRMHVICPSRWLAGCARDSALMAGWPVHVVPYALDLGVFSPGDRSAARTRLGLPHDRRLVLFGAPGGQADRRKGFDLFVDALARVCTELDDVTAVTFGAAATDARPAAPFPIVDLGVIRDDATLARAYRAADVAVVPSRQDNLAQCGTEAQACGVPTVAFRIGGMPDVLEHGETGWLVDELSGLALADGIMRVLLDPARTAMGHAARARAVRAWAPEVIVARHLDVYRAAIDGAS
ncbi:MAG TPA: glycosyltransferase, partial [Longimicrobiales bacterium]|nr:glycosyltransferase [Longimicrobiales bacterium]